MVWVQKTLDREKAYRAVINTWLKASSENRAVCRAVIEQNKFRRSQMKDEYGGVKGFPKDMRIGISLPPGLFYTLVQFERMHDREFMQTKEDLHWFAKKFPQFVVVDRI